MESKEKEYLKKDLECLGESIKQMVNSLEDMKYQINTKIKIDEIDRKIDEINIKISDLNGNIIKQDDDTDNIFGALNVGMMLVFWVIAIIMILYGSCFLFFEKNEVFTYCFGKLCRYIYVATVSVLAVCTFCSGYRSIWCKKNGGTQKTNTKFIFILAILLINLLTTEIPFIMISVNTLPIKIHGYSLCDSLLEALKTTDKFCQPLTMADLIFAALNLHAVFIKENQSRTWRYNSLALSVAAFSIMISFMLSVH